MRLPITGPRRHIVGAALTSGLAVVFCLLLLRANPNLCWNDDYAISILPVLTDIARSWHEGSWPLLSSSSWACGNLAGEYQYGTFSLFINAAIVAVWQFPLTFPAQAAAMSFIHVGVLAAGAFLLARRRRLAPAVATMVALVASLNGWIIGWGATDWFGAIAAEAWLPWCWWAFETAMWPRPRPGESRLRGRWRFLLPAPFVYLLFTAGFPYTVVMLALVSAWLAARVWAERRFRALAPLAVGWVLGIGLAAPAWLSLLTYMAGSSRSQGAGAGNFVWTVPLTAWPGMFLPNWTTDWRDFGNQPSQHAALELAGALVPLAGLLAAWACRRRALWRAVRWELGLLGVIVLLCILPSPGVFRWSFRWLPLFHLVLALAGGRALSLVLAARRRGFCLKWSPGAWACAMVAVTWGWMTLAHTANADALTRDLPWLTLIAAAAWMLGDAVPEIVRRFHRFPQISRRFNLRNLRMILPAAMAFVSLWITYRHMYTNPGLPVYAFGPSLTRIAPLSPDRLYMSFHREADQAYRDWQTGPGFGAVLRPGSTGMFAGVRLINGYSPIMARGIGRRLTMETHGNLPNDVSENLLRHEAGPDGLLARLGVDGMMIAREYYPLVAPPPADEWEEMFSSVEGTVYHRRGGALPEVRAWDSAAPGGSRGYGPARLGVVESARLSVNVEVAVDPKGIRVLLAFRRPYFPGYVATLDGAPLPVTSYEGLLPTVELPPGSHGKLVLSYRPRAVTWGAALAAASLLLMGGGLLSGQAAGRDKVAYTTFQDG